jgi:hypothetical protein
MWSTLETRLCSAASRDSRHSGHRPTLPKSDRAATETGAREVATAIIPRIPAEAVSPGRASSHLTRRAVNGRLTGSRA